MSLRTLIWAIEQAPVPASHNHLVATLFILANSANTDGYLGHINIEYVASCTRRTPSQVQADLKELTDLGLLTGFSDSHPYLSVDVVRSDNDER